MTDIKQCMRDILAHESRAVAEIPVTDGYERAVGMIVEQVWNRPRRFLQTYTKNINFCKYRTKKVCLLSLNNDIIKATL